MRSSKGSAYERTLCKELSLWWTGGDRDDIYWRTSQSGGRSKTRMKGGKRTFGQYGDIQAVDPVGQPLLKVLTVEIKRGYNRETILNAMDREPHCGKEVQSAWELFVSQVREDAANARTPHWILIHKRDRRQAVVYVPFGLYDRLASLRRVRPYLVGVVAGVQVLCTPLAQFLKRVSPDNIRALAERKVVRTRVL